jgi:hypothetical protein
MSQAPQHAADSWPGPPEYSEARRRSPPWTGRLARERELIFLSLPRGPGEPNVGHRAHFHARAFCELCL